MRTVAVTGASGLIGRHLCAHFLRSGWSVRALVRVVEAFPIADEPVHVFRCDLPEVLDSTALVGADAVVHCAYHTRFTSLSAAQRVNEGGTKRVFHAARQAGVRRFVFLSSMSAAPDAESYYGRSKYALEQLCDPERDLIVRPGLVLARDGGLFRRLQSLIRWLPLLPVLADGGRRVQTIHIDDLCLGIERALTLDVTGRLTLAEPEGLTLTELLLLMASCMGVQRGTVKVPVRPLLWALHSAEFIGLPLPVSSENVLGLAGLRPQATGADLTKLNLTVRSARASVPTLV